MVSNYAIFIISNTHRRPREEDWFDAIRCSVEDASYVDFPLSPVALGAFNQVAPAVPEST